MNLTRVVTSIGRAVLVLFVVYTAVFIVVTVLPGDPISNRLADPSTTVSAEDVAQLKDYYGLDLPVWQQYFQSLSRFLTGDLGVSLSTAVPVKQMIVQNLPSTMILTASSLALVLVLSFSIAFAAFLLPRVVGAPLRALPSVSLSIPGFLVSLIILNIFCFKLGLWRLSTESGFAANFFPALALAIPVSAPISQVLLTGLEQAARQNYRFVADARGLSRRSVFWKHLVRPASIPTLTMLGLAAGAVLGGSIITESIFGRAGLGAVIETAVGSQDVPVIQALVLLSAVIYIVINLITDLVYPLLDPRIKNPAARREVGASA